MNSSPPPPSFTLPPLNSAGQFPITPSPTPSPDKELSGHDFKRKPKARRPEADEEEAGGRISMYVRLFEEMIETVLASEAYLFTAREIWVLRHILSLPYEPKYLLTRLLLRRQGKIHPYNSLIIAYSAELGDEGVKRAMKTLSSPLPIPPELLQAEPDAPSPESGPSRMQMRTPKSAKAKGKEKAKPWSDIPTGLSAEDEQADPDLAEAIRESIWASQVRRVEIDDEGAVIATPPPERPQSSRSSSSSSTGSNASPKRLAGYDEEFSLLPKAPSPVSTLARSESTMTLDEIMSCISAEDLRKIARGRKIPLAMLGNREAVCAALRGVATKQSVLGFTPVKGKGKQPTLPFSPAARITSETLLLNQLLPLLGHHALQLTPQIHALVSRVNLIFSRTPPIAGSSSLMLPSILVTSHKRRYPDYGSPARSIIWTTREELLTWERAVGWEAVVADALGDTWQEQRKNPSPIPGFGFKKEILPRVEGAKVAKRIWEGVWPIWKQEVEGESGKERMGLAGDRFQTAHVLTRIVYKGATALGVLHEYDLECMVLRELLAQRRWRRGKRGAWYDRLALVLMNHYNATPEEKEAKCIEATQVCIDGLLDEDTHLIYRPGLSRRLTRLENKLNLPADERHISHAELLKCEIRELTAPRVPENMGQAKIRPRAESYSEREREASLGMGDEVNQGVGGVQQVGKSVWVGRDGEVTVEGWVLEWWEKKGYKGYHSESSILTTLFGLLLWPVLFHPVQGAFETPYQTAPLDLGEDTFAPSRQDVLEKRLEEMSKTTRAVEMLHEVDDRERPRLTWAVGVNWEFGREDLSEVLECIGGRAMSGICRMLAEEYRHRISGVPDLMVWHPVEKIARFVEVKGPGDSLSETQKVWIDVLLSAGVPVEVCKVKAKVVAVGRATGSEDQIDTDGKVSVKGRPKAKVEQKPKVTKGVKRRSDEKDRNGWKRVKEYNLGDGTAVEDDEEEGEFAYESGEEGKGEGRWEARG